MRINLKQYVPALLAFTLSVPAAAPALAQQSRDVGQQIEAQYGVIRPDTSEGRRLNNQLDRVVERIVDGVNQEHPNKRFRLRSARLLGGRSEKYDKVVNAFALPDGRIYVTLGLMRLIQNDRNADDELAFVVGHEVTHVVEKHSSEQSKKSLPYYLGAAILGAATRSEVVGGLGALGAQAQASHFSREDEYKADKGGLLAMRAAGFDPRGAADMLRRLEAQSGGGNSGITWFSSHPITRNRVERVQKMTGDIDNGRNIRNRSGSDYDRQSDRDNRDYQDDRDRRNRDRDDDR